MLITPKNYYYIIIHFYTWGVSASDPGGADPKCSSSSSKTFMKMLVKSRQNKYSSFRKKE